MPGVVILLAALMVGAAFTHARAWPYLVLISALDEIDATGKRYSEFWKGNGACARREKKYSNLT